MIDVDQLRRDTAGCEQVIHLNNCGASLQPRQVVDAVVDYLRAEELSGGYETAASRQGDLDRLYDASARYLGCTPAEVAFVQSAGDAWWRAFSSVTLATGDRVLVGRSEYQANAFGWLQARERGVIVDVVPNDAAGEFDLDVFETMLDERVKLVALTMISLSNGAIHPAAELGERLRASGSEAIYLLDACQAAGQLPLDVATIGCDFLAYTGRKFIRGPRGTGVLYASSSVMDRLGPSPFVDGRSATWATATTYKLEPDAKRFEFGEFGYAAKVGLGVATDYMLEVGVAAIAERIDRLAQRTRSGLIAIEGVRVHDEGVRRCGIVTFTVDGASPDTVLAALQQAGINAGAPFRALAQLDLGQRELAAVVRIGVHYFNTDRELDRFVSVVDGIAAAAGSAV